jgi:hypothetical protein
MCVCVCVYVCMYVCMYVCIMYEWKPMIEYSICSMHAFQDFNDNMHICVYVYIMCVYVYIHVHYAWIPTYQSQYACIMVNLLEHACML